MNQGMGPDLLGVQEVENAGLLERLIKEHLNKKNYQLAYAESPDDRGIDNGLIYDADLFKLIDVKPIAKEGSYLYKRNWNMLDQIIVSK